MDISVFLNRVNALVLNPVISLLFAVALLIFVWGIFQFIKSGTQSDTGREEGKRKILFGLIGMFIMFGAYGIINLLLGTFGIDVSEETSKSSGL